MRSFNIQIIRSNISVRPKKMFNQELSNAPWSRLFAIISLIISVLFYRDIIDKFQLYFNFKLIKENHEYWRLLTSLFCFGPFGLSVVINIYNFLIYSIDIESFFFANRPADFFLFCIFGWVVMWIGASYYPMPFLGGAFSSFLLYYWCKRNPDRRVTLVQIPIPIPAKFIPFVILILQSGEGINSLISVLIAFGAAHLYFFFSDCISVKYDVQLLKFPSIVNRFLLHLLN